MFLEKRVYQGSSGRVYPLPFIDRIASEPVDRQWDAIHIENEYLRLMVLPEVGGRIHIGYDKVSGYDFFYRQNVIKPALVGLAGPWISGGVEFNWPQHHRPATFMPVETEIEYATGGDVTIWCSDHDPMLRMKGMHGVCLRPGRAALELKVRLYNRTQFTHTFLWWANVATRVHEQYQSFFPTDVRYVADHAKRAVTSIPLSDRPYYGTDYPARAKDGVPAEELPGSFRPDGSYAANDLSWYANIPVPTSYMITGTSQDFFGGYDHRAQAGVVHVADHHIAPGKKQWTWGNHEFGYAWDRNLTDSDGPYIELMAGVYTDNQPDFSYLAPWETKTFTQNWYPIRRTGIPQMANTEAAIHLKVECGAVHVAVGVTRDCERAEVQLLRGGELLQSWPTALRVSETFMQTVLLNQESALVEFSVKIVACGATVLEYVPANILPAAAPEVAQEPLPPEQIESVEELYLTGLHLEQYRHATRQPELYWREALVRDPGETRCLNALGRWHLGRGEMAEAVAHFRQAIQRLTRLNPNPYDGEPLYYLGITLRYLNQHKEAYDALFKATWNAAWRGPAYFAIAEIDASRCEWSKAEAHLRQSLRAETDNLNARNLLAYVLQQMGRNGEAAEEKQLVFALDPLDIGARWSCGHMPTDGQMLLDLALDLIRCGRNAEAQGLLQAADLRTVDGATPMILLVLADLQATTGKGDANETLNRVNAISHDLSFPSRIEEMLVLQRTIERSTHHALASYLLGNWLYDRRRHIEAIEAWESAATAEPGWPTVWRNLGIAYFNIQHDPDAAVRAFDRAFANEPTDGRVLYERDQLWKRIGRSPEARVAELSAHRTLIGTRDDLGVELATLYNDLGRPDDALRLLLHRRFQPWEGGEGLVLGQFVRAELLLGRRAMDASSHVEALEHFESALKPPHNLSEAKHLLSNQSDVYFWLGRACEALERKEDAAGWYEKAVRQRGDFQQMSVRRISDMTLWSGLALQRLGRGDQASRLFMEVSSFAETLDSTPPKIDYFATSLPTMLLFEDDLAKATHTDAAFLKAQALFGLGAVSEADELLHFILEQDANHAGARDLLSMQHLLCEKTGRH
ncbi:DUF5107 domain-containing protein [Edaphobacter bradus]|uniref:DUF5107 domain-containing protein n=1 Tax=Edaphobacter bradus TaxID=2259016 RepID=UPI0021E0EC30|nr:DUF5107 domain-containing protein [Edaphobacter bradus]